jgi:Phasin protein
MATPAQHPRIGDTQAAFPPNLMQAHERNSALITRANEMMVNTARAVWESEMELLRLESEQFAKTLVPLKLGSDPAAAASVYCAQWQEGSEKLLNQMRTVSDLVRKCGWDLFQIYQESLHDAAMPFEPR